MKRFLIIIAVLVCIGVGTAAVLEFTGAADISEYFGSKEEESESAFYVSFMDSFFVMDTDGTVLMCTLSEPSGIPLVENMKFNSLSVGYKADAKSKSTLSYVLEVCSLLKAYSLEAGTIGVSDDGDLTLYMEDAAFSIILGTNDDTDIKIKDLNSLYPSLLEYEGGILYMTSADTNGNGYTFKAASDGEDEADEEEGSSEEETETSAAQEETTAAETQAQTAAETTQAQTTQETTQEETTAGEETQTETTQETEAAETTQEETQSPE